MLIFTDLVMYVLYLHAYFIYCTLAEECDIVFSSLSSTLTGSSIASVMKPPSMEYTQQNISVVLQTNSSVTIVSDSHTTFSSSPVTTLGVVECLTTSNSVVTSISGQATITINTGMYVCIHKYTVDYFRCLLCM